MIAIGRDTINLLAPREADSVPNSIGVNGTLREMRSYCAGEHCSAIESPTVTSEQLLLAPSLARAPTDSYNLPQ
jgi:hypothetical protein